MNERIEELRGFVSLLGLVDKPDPIQVDYPVLVEIFSRLQEHTALLQEERARAFEEAAKIATAHALENGPTENFEMGGHAIATKIRAARSPGDAEKGE